MFHLVHLFRQPAREALWQDLHHAVRSLRKHRGITAVAVLSLALGIGANTAIFAVMNAVLLRALPVADPASLVLLSHRGKQDTSDDRAQFTNVPLYEYLRDTSECYSGLIAFSPTHLRLRQDGGTISVSAHWVSANYFSVLGVRASLGRTWQPDDEARPDVAVISDRMWRRDFGTDPGVIGKTATLSGRPVTIIGVLPPQFLGLIPGTPADVTLLLAAQPTFQPERGNLLTLGRSAKDEPLPTWELFLLGRLKPGVTRASAEAETTVRLRQWAANRGASDEYVEAAFARAVLVSGGKGLDPLRRRFAAPLWVLAGIVGGVFLIACANVANLLLVRGAARQHEIAVRAALGASRGRLMRHVLAEGVVLTTAGGAAGFVLGWWGSSFLATLIGTGRAAIELEVHPDWRVLLFAGAVSALGGLAVGLVPALSIAHDATTGALKDGDARGSGRGGGRWSQALVVSQIAVSLCLLVTTGLFVGNLRQITAINTGYQADHLLSFSFDWSGAGYTRAQMMAFVERAVEAVAAVPGVEAASATHIEPLGGQQSQRWLSTRDASGDPKARVVELNVVSGDYFRTMRLPVLHGRAFDSRDKADSPKVAIINEALARACFGDSNAIGQQAWIARDAKGIPLTIVGVVQDSKQRDLREPPLPFLFLPATQSTAWEMNLVVRTAVEPAPLVPGLRRVLAGLSGDIALRDVTTPQMQMARTLLQERVLSTLSAFFGPLALLLAAIGLYGLLAYNVALRTREIGIRMALGARPPQVLGLVLRQGMSLVALGSVFGFVGVVLVAGVLRRFLFALSPYNPFVAVLAVTVLGVIAVLACWLPARRAAKVDPMVALRRE